jgi:hypothetical protein
MMIAWQSRLCSSEHTKCQVVSMWMVRAPRDVRSRTVRHLFPVYSLTLLPHHAVLNGRNLRDCRTFGTSTGE